MMCLLAVPVLTKAQTATDTVPYCCDFESAVERAYWRFAHDATNKWAIGFATQTGTGLYSMYISNDGGGSLGYTGTVTNTYAYRRLHVPAGVYEVNYDWMARGYRSGSTYYGYMRAFLIPAATTTLTGGQVLAGLSATSLPAGAISLDAGAMLNNSVWSTFNNPIVQVPTTMDYYMVFFWYNNTSVYAPPAAVDNICLTPVSCPKPMNITRRDLGNGCVEVGWTDFGNPQPTGWIIEYGQRGFAPGNGTRVYTATKPYTLCGLAEDVTYEILIQAICSNGDTSGYSQPLYVRYCSQNVGCIDFTNLRGPDVTCTYGTFTQFGNYTASRPGPYANTGIRNPNNGQGVYNVSEGASHQIMTDVTAKDTLTGFQLYTIPPDACKSVRLGCIYGAYLCQAAAYRITVDTSVSDIALVNYAVVLVDPTNQHNVLSEPRFLFEVLDSNDQLISPTCGYSNINVSEARASWNRGITIAGGHQVYWKDWTPIGLDLSAYHGETITVRITVFACGAGAVDHSGYMYYTLGCSKARILANTCGGEAQSATLTAPSGFRYRWYNPNLPGWTSDQQTITVNIDSSVYYCDVMFVDDSTCYFTISTMASPRFPHASFSATLDTTGCNYTVNVVNKSYASISATDTNSLGPCESFLWDWGDGSTSRIENPGSHTYSSPGTYTIMLISALAGGECTDTIYKTITFNPPVAPTISGDSVVCINTLAHIQVDGATAQRFLWSNGATTRDVAITATDSTTLTVRVWDQLGCETVLSFHVDIDTVPLPIFNPATYESCMPYTMTIADVNPVSRDNTYSWSWGDGTGTRNNNNPTHTYSDAGTYQFYCYIVSAEGCMDTVSRTAYVYGYPHGSFSWNPPVVTVTNPEVQFVNLTVADPSNIYRWEVFCHTSSPTVYENVFEPMHRWTCQISEFSGSNLVRLITTNQVQTISGATVQCVDTVENNVLIINDLLQFPNVVTPNGDGQNDIFEIKNLIDGGGYTENELFIYNHWGRLVYHKKNITTRDDFWDPSVNKDPDGTYYYRFSAKGYLGDVQRNGTLVVISNK